MFCALKMGFAKKFSAFVSQNSFAEAQGAVAMMVANGQGV